MKKLLSLLLAGMILISLTGVMAENMVELTAGVAVDTETALAMTQMLGGMTDESQLAMIRTMLSVINSFSIATIADETGGDVSLRISGQEFANVIFSQNEGIVAVTSTLFPNYALTIDPELLETAMSGSGVTLDPQMAAQAMEALQPYGQDIEGFVAGLAAEAETAQGDFTVEGAQYSSSTSIRFTSGQFLKLALTLVERAQKDTAIQGIITGIMAQSGNAPGVSVAEALAQARAQISDMLAKGSMDVASFKQYTNEAGTCVIVETVPQETMTLRLIAKETKVEGGSSSTFQLSVAEDAVTDWEAALQEMQGGQSSKGLLVQGAMDVAATDAEKRSSGSLQVTAGGLGGMTIVLSIESVEPFDNTAAKTFIFGLGLGAVNQLVKLSFSAAPASVYRAVDLTGKTLIAIAPDMDESLLAPLQSDIMNNGLPALLARLQVIAPEASLLLALLSTGGQPQEQPVPGLPANP